MYIDNPLIWGETPLQPQNSVVHCTTMAHHSIFDSDPAKPTSSPAAADEVGFAGSESKMEWCAIVVQWTTEFCGCSGVSPQIRGLSIYIQGVWLYAGSSTPK